MSTFIRTIGRVALNGFSFDVYENKNGTATIRPNKNGSDLPTKKWITYESLDQLENAVDSICGDATGTSRVHILKQRFL